MNVVLWIVQALLALAFAFAGLSKLTQPRQALIDRGMAYVQDLPQPLVKVIGTLEELRDKIPPQLYDMVASHAQRPAVEDLDI